MINIEELILPISEDSICGKYLKYEHLYDQIKEYRREDDPRLTQGVWQTDPKKADWKEVQRLCIDALKNETKDLQIATWLLEASIVLDGFQGLNQGTMLLHALCEKFWDDIYPLPDWENANNIARMAPIYFFTEKVAEKIVLTPLTAPMDGMSSVYSLSDWLTVRHNIRTKNINGLSAKDVKKSVNTTPIDFFQQVEADVSASMENIKKLDNLLAELSGNDSPSFRLIYDHFNDINRINTNNLADMIKRTSSSSQNRNTVEEITLDSIVSDEGQRSSAQSVVTVANGQEKEPTIEDAYEVLQDIAVFLEKEQPQSPASILLKIAFAIGKKTFNELLEINTSSGASVMSTISELYKVVK